MQCGLAGANLVVTEPLFTLPSIQRATQEMAFEDLGVASLCSIPAAKCCLHAWAAERGSGDPIAQSLSGVVLDAGYSATTAVPIFDGRVQLNAVRRIRIGGKLLTNLLKEWVRLIVPFPLLAAPLLHFWHAAPESCHSRSEVCAQPGSRTTILRQPHAANACQFWITVLLTLCRRPPLVRKSAADAGQHWS
jgi:actin-related protein